MLGKEYVSEPQFIEDVKTAILSNDYFRTRKTVESNEGTFSNIVFQFAINLFFAGKLSIVLNGRPVTLVIGQDFFYNAYDRSKVQVQ